MSADETTRLLWEINVPGPILSSPVFASGVLYINTLRHLIAVASSPASGDSAPAERKKLPDTIYVPTVQDIVERMLEVAAVKPSDRVYDLGSGDGRIVITAASKYGCHAVSLRKPWRIFQIFHDVHRKQGRSDHFKIVLGEGFAR